MMIIDTFKDEINKMLLDAKRSGKKFVDITSKEVHTNVGGYPGKNHRMPICCSAMREIMRGNDYVVSEPPSGKGATLVIRYFL